MDVLKIAMDMGKEQVVNRIRNFELKEYGVENNLIADQWMLFLSSEEVSQKTIKVIAGLNNSDMEGVLLEVLRNEPEKVFEGLCITAYVLNAESKVLYIPSYANDIALNLEEMARSYNISIQCGMVDVREEKNNFICHLVTMKEIVDCVEEIYDEKVYVAINKATLKTYPKSTKISDIIDLDSVKSLEAGYKMWDPNKIKMFSLEDLDISNGVLNTFTEKDCIVNIVKSRLETYHNASCGKCVFCREGLIQLSGMTKDLTNGKGKTENIDVMKEIGSAMTYSNLCTIGQVSANIALSSFDNFNSEFESHIKKKCKANVCSAFNNIYIDPKECSGCEECVDVCPQDCIEGKSGFIHMIDELDCTKCGLCIDVCPEDAIISTTNRLPKLPTRLIKCGKFKR